MADINVLPAPFEEDITAKLTRAKQMLEVALGRALAPADIEMLLLNVFVYEISLLNIQANAAYRQSLVKFATGVQLDYLGELVGVTRLPATGASCTLQFNIVDGHNAIVLPQGIRIQSVDGQVIFTTNISVDIPIGTNTITVTAFCQTTGAAGNGYDVGKISILLDPQPFVTSVGNINITNGGIDDETDDQLRERIKLAPASFSVAGPKGAYIFFAKSAHPSIVDVACVTTNPGEVTLYPLCSGGTLPSTEIKAAVLAICSDEKIRPQNDTVLVDDPSVTEYAIEVELTKFTDAIDQDLLDTVNANLSQFENDRLNKMGVDIVRDQINALCMIKDKTYKVNIVHPAADIVSNEQTYSRCTGISVTITGSNNG